jgi:gliding motility-associated-like protein
MRAILDRTQIIMMVKMFYDFVSAPIIRIIIICVLSLLSFQSIAQECNIVFVSPNGANAGAAGTKATPASLTYALTLISPTNNQIWLAAGNYNISTTIDLISGVTIEGGFNPATWVKSNSTPSIINRDNLNVLPAPNRLVAISCVGISNFNVNDLTVNVANAVGSGVTTYGIYLSGCSDYKLTRLKVNSGDATDGDDGIPGVDGIDGVNGTDGSAGNECGAGNTGGGPGGNSGAGFPGGNGGDGGPEGDPLVIWPPWDFDLGEGFDATPGLPGNGPCGGAGGTGGQGNTNALPSSVCFFIGACTAGVNAHGGAGVAGGDGLDGANGVDGIPAHAGGFFVPGDGQNGVDGEHGCGGGGGGGGGSHGGAALTDNGSGSGGGGGGEGGQGGTGATGGAGGGGSFGIYVDANGANGEISDCIVTAGAPGMGGLGGIPGGYGGFGGFGGQGGGSGCTIGRGGLGGDGGNAGRGGTGGNGAPGVSQEVYEDPNGIAVAQTNMNAPVEPNVFLTNTGCTWHDIDYSTNASGIIQWYFDGGSIPLSAFGQSVTTQYNLLGRHDITLVSNGVPFMLSDFEGIFADGTPFLPEIVAPDSACPGQAVNFSAIFPSVFNVLAYDWDFGDPTSGASNTSAAAAPAHTFANVGNYWVTLQTTSACCGRSKVDSFLIHIVPFRLPEVFISADQDNICFGDVVEFAAVPVWGGYTPAFEWFVNGNSSGTNPTITLPGLSNGDLVYCELTSSYTCPTQNPVQSPTINITVNPLPTPVCSSTLNYLGANTEFDVTSVVGTQPFTYAWDFGDGGTAATQNPTHTFGGTGVYNTSVLLTDANGCEALCNLPVDIIIPPVVTAEFTAVINQTCANTTVNFTDISTGNVINWFWDFGDPASGANNTSNLQNPTHVYTTPGFYNITFAPGNGVLTDTIILPNYVEVLENPVADFMSYETTYCEPADVKFYDVSDGAVAWAWDFGDGGTSDIQNPWHTYDVDGIYTVSLTITSADGCTNTTTYNNYITILPSPEAEFEADSIVCTTVPIPFTDLSIDANAWSWDFGDGGGFTDSIQFPSHAYQNPGEFTVTLAVTNALGCTDTLVKPLYMEVVPYPNADFAPDSIALQLPDTIVQIFNYSTDYDMWEWDFGNGDTITDLNPEVHYPLPGDYNMILYVSNRLGCVDTLIIPFSVFEMETFFAPNSFTADGDGLNEYWKGYGKGITQYSLRVFNRWGEMVFFSNYIDQPWDGTDLKGVVVPQGVYTYTVSVQWYTGKTFSRAGTVTLIR